MEGFMEEEQFLGFGIIQNQIRSCLRFLLWVAGWEGGAVRLIGGEQ
jgi:hypothetical protein